jgi:hypothetical protein
MPAPPDRLSKLPTELLDMIFDDAWAKQRPSGPIYRALCPFYDRFAWRSIRIDSRARLARFFELTERQTHLGQLYKELVVQLKPEELDVATLTGLLGRTPNLKKLALADLASQVFELILHGTKNSLLPRHLRKLDLTCTTGGRKDPYHPSNWSLLNDLKSLNQLALDLRSAETPTGRIKSKKELPSWADITDLDIDLPQDGLSSVLQLIASFPNLRRLQLSSTSPVPDSAGALDALQNPASLHELVLVGVPKKEWTLPDKLAQLTNLHRLKLVGEWHHLAPTDIERICDLPLRRFELGPNSEFSLQPFYEALQRGKLADLEELHFDNLTCRVGYKAHYDKLPRSWERQIALIRNYMHIWDRPEWNKNFRVGTFRQLVSLCKRRKIKVNGTIASALRVEKALNRMQRDLDELDLMIRSRGTGAYRGINEGRRYADDRNSDEEEDEDEDDSNLESESESESWFY